MSESHRTRQLQSRDLLGALNRWPDHPRLKAVRMILELAKSLERTNLRDLRDLSKSDRPRRIAKLNRLLSQYRLVPVLEAGAYGLGLKWGGYQWRTKSLWEADQVAWIANLAQRGLLYRIRRCEMCQKWFYAKADHQHYCSGACRQKHHADSDDYRAGRAKYMRNYRKIPIVRRRKIA